MSDSNGDAHDLLPSDIVFRGGWEGFSSYLHTRRVHLLTAERYIVLLSELSRDYA